MTVLLAGTALGASALLPGNASAQPGAHGRTDVGTTLPDRSDDSDGRSGSDGRADERRSGRAHHGRSGSDGRADERRSGRHRSASHRPPRSPAHTRPMTSGERQYRNGCRQGYILNDCEQFDVGHLLRRGIDPFL